MLRRGKLIAAFLLGSAAALAVTALPPYLFLQQKPQDLPKTLLIDEPIFESTAAFLQHADKVFSIVEVRLNAANWAFETNITDANQEQVTEVELEMNKVKREKVR